jgi:hypothetical protein
VGYIDLSTLHDPAYGQTPPVGWGDQIDLNVKWLQGKPRARIHLGANQTIPHATDTLLAFGPEDIDSHGFHNGGAPTQLKIPAGLDGHYRVSARVRWQQSGGGIQRRAALVVNNAVEMDEDIKGPSAAEVTNYVSTLWFPAVGDYFTVRVYQDRGGDLDALSSGYAGCFFEIEWVGKGVG